MMSLGFALTLFATAPSHPARVAATCENDRAALMDADADIDGDGASLAEHLPAPAAPEDYATPAVIDCRLPVISPALQALVGECAGVTVPDASYRTSRLPESEAPVGSFVPVRPESNAKRRLTMVAGVPAQPTTSLAPPSAQPLALFALPDFPRPAVGPVFASDETAPRDALGRRLERPPRA